MMRKDGGSQRGQSLIIIALVMTILLIFTAFAVDLAYWYVQRRQMQNAADSGALAGARELAMYQTDSTATLTNGQLYSLILDWAQRNRAQTIQALYVRQDGTRFAISAGDSGAAPKSFDEAVGVYVIANGTFHSFFAPILGINSLSASGEAESRYGSALSISGIMPLAYRYSDIWNVPDPHQLFDGNDKKARAEWGWLGLDCEFPSKCSPDTNQLKDWIVNGFDGSIRRYRSYMGDPGIKAGVLKEVQVGEIVLLPLFDRVFKFVDNDLGPDGQPLCNVDEYGSPIKDEFEGYDELGVRYTDRVSYCGTECSKDYDDVWCAHTNNTVLVNSYYYHIMEFAAFKVTAVSQGGHVLDGHFINFVAEGSWTDPNQWDKGVIVIKLTE